MVRSGIKNHITPQNNCCWLLFTFANGGIAAGNTSERCWQKGPILLLLWQSSLLWKNEIYVHIGLLSCKERGKNHMVRDQVSTEGVAKLLPCMFL